MGMQLNCMSPACMYSSLPLLPSSFLLFWVYEAIFPKHGCHIKQLPYKYKSTKYFDILLLLTYVGGCPACTYCPNLSSKLYHLTHKQHSNSLPFLHYELVTEHSFIIESKFFPYPVIMRAY